MRISDWSSDVCSSDLKPEQRRQDREEEPGVNAEEGDLEYRIEGDQTGHILIVTPGELVPHQHHRDAPRETDKDDAGHIFRAVAQEDHGEREIGRASGRERVCQYV